MNPEEKAHYELVAEWALAKAQWKNCPIQVKSLTANDWVNCDSIPSEFQNNYKWRKTPELKLEPWTFEYILKYPEISGAWFRPKGHFAFGSGFVFGPGGIEVTQGFNKILRHNSPLLRYEEVLQFLEWSTDLKTWNPCGKVVS